MSWNYSLLKQVQQLRYTAALKGEEGRRMTLLLEWVLAACSGPEAGNVEAATEPDRARTRCFIR